MSNEPEARKPEDNQNKPSDELELEELDDVVGGGGKQRNPPPQTPPTESLSLNFTKIEYEYKPQ